jgi:hypothetical protein
MDSRSGEAVGALHMPNTGNWHGETFTRWSAALSAAPAPTGRRTRFHGVSHPPISLDQHCLITLFFLHAFITKSLFVKRSAVPGASYVTLLCRVATLR